MLARNLLADDGVIFISIDENEIDDKRIEKVLEEAQLKEFGCLAPVNLTDNEKVDDNGHQKRHEELWRTETIEHDTRQQCYIIPVFFAGQEIDNQKRRQKIQ